MATFLLVPIGIAEVHRIISGIGIAVEIHALLPWVIGIRLREPSEVGVVIPSVQIHQPALGVIALVDVAFAVEHLGAIGCERLAEGAIVRHLGAGWRIALDHAVGGQVVFEAEVHGLPHAGYVGVEIGGEQA